jgi:hypothetical protein
MLFDELSVRLHREEWMDCNETVTDICTLCSDPSHGVDCMGVRRLLQEDGDTRKLIGLRFGNVGMKGEFPVEIVNAFSPSVLLLDFSSNDSLPYPNELTYPNGTSCLDLPRCDDGNTTCLVAPLRLCSSISLLWIVQEGMMGNIIGGAFGGFFLAAVVVVGYSRKKKEVHTAMTRIRRSISMSSLERRASSNMEDDGSLESTYKINRKTGEFSYGKGGGDGKEYPLTPFRAVWDDEPVTDETTGIKYRTNRQLGLFEHEMPLS